MKAWSTGRRGAVSKRLILALAVVVVVVVALGASAYLFLLRPGPEQVVRRYFLAVDSGDVDALRATLTAESAARIPPGAKLRKPTATEQPSPDIGKARVQGDQAVVPVKTKGPVLPGMPMGAGEASEDFVTRKENGQWKVDLLATLQGLLQGLRQAPPEGPPGGPPEEPGPGGP